MREGILIGVGALLISSIALAAPTPEQRCQAAKNLLAGKYAACRQKVEGQLILNPDQDKYDEGINRCATRLETKWLKAEQRAGGACPSGATAAEVDATTRLHADAVAARVGGTARFTDNSNGTISDRQTGLQWEKKVSLDGSLDFPNLNDADNWFVWSNRCEFLPGKLCQPSPQASDACAAGTEGDSIACITCGPGEGACTYFPGYTTIWEWLAQLNMANFAGHNDWRVAKRQELESLLDLTVTGSPTTPATYPAFHGANCSTGCTDVTNPACACTNPAETWTATSVAPNPGNAWVVPFNDGDPFYRVYTTYRYVRAVRSR